MVVDNGIDSEQFHVDNDNSGTRLSLNAETRIDDGLEAGGEFEIEFQSNPSNEVDFDNRSIGAEVDERVMEAWLEVDTWGRFTLGQGPGAADGVMETDLSGTASINWSNPALLGSDIRFGGSGPRIGQTMSNQDFEGRYDRLRYDFPRLGIFKFALSHGSKEQSDVVEAALRAEYKFDGGARFKAAIGYSNEKTGDPDTGDEVTTGGSIELRLGMGLTLGFASAKSGDDDIDNPDSTYQAKKFGYRAGDHAVSILLVKVEDRHRAGDISESSGIGYVYAASKWARPYLGYKIHSLDRPGEQFDDIKILTGGIRVNF